MKKSGLSVICMTFAVDYQQLRKPGDAYNRFVNGLSAIDKLLESNNLKLTKQPLLISHTGLDTQLGQNETRAKMMRPRLISKQQAKIVADAGGVIGVWTHLADSPLAYAQNIRALVDVVGVDHVCIGTDTKLTPAYRSAVSFGSRPAGPAPQPGGTRNNGRLGERTNEAWADQQVGFYYAVVNSMLKTGFTEAEIGKIGGGNFCRVFNAAIAGRK